jgi:hypothetical protein
MEGPTPEWLDVPAGGGEGEGEGGGEGEDEESLLKRTPPVKAAKSSLMDMFRDDSSLAFAGPMLAQFSIYAYRFLLVPWLWRGEGLQLFIPVLSPVYRQAEHWQAGAETRAIVLHIVSGSLLLLLGLAQFDKSIRRGYPRLHRWSGRAYAACGLVCMYYLRQLRGSVGAGSAPGGRSYPLVVFIDVSSALWVLATGAGVVCAVRRDFPLHRDLMACSLAMASVPIAQRTISWFFLAPFSIVVRLLICLLAGSPPWRADFGPPGSAASALLGQCSEADRAADPRACPGVLSADGYGEAEQCSFALSAWLGFATVLAFGVPRLLRHVRGAGAGAAEAGKLDPNADLSELHLSDVWRTIPPAVCAALSQLQEYAARALSIVGVRGGGGGVCAARCAAGALLPLAGALLALGVSAALVSLTVFVALLYLTFIFVPIYTGYMLLLFAFRVLILSND